MDRDTEDMVNQFADLDDAEPTAAAEYVRITRGPLDGTAKGLLVWPDEDPDGLDQRFIDDLDNNDGPFGDDYIADYLDEVTD